MGIQTQRPKEISLFSGIGGGCLGSKLLGWRTVCYVEWDEYCQKVLKQRIEDGVLVDAPIWDDVQTFDGSPWRGEVDIVKAGFPCQPFSQAGDRAARNDSRNMWPETIRVIREIQPEAIMLENVPNIINFEYFGEILGGLASNRYHAVWSCLPAQNIGTPHKRTRLWLLAYADWSRPEKFNVSPKPIRERSYSRLDYETTGMSGHKWGIEPEFPRVVDGAPHRMDRLRSIGNAQVPQQMAYAFYLLHSQMLEVWSSK